MSCLEMRKGSKWWYGRWSTKGQTSVKNLDIEIEGRRPASINLEGDRRFEQSRTRAQVKLEGLARTATGNRRASELVQELHRLQTGQRISSIALTGITQAWLAMPRRKPVSASQSERAGAIFTRFVAFMNTSYPTVTDMAGVTPEMAIAFMHAEGDRGIAGRTHNATLTLMRGTFKHLRRQAALTDNPFDDIVSREQNTLHRKPFKQDELQALLEAAKADVFCNPLIVTGACTALRLGDVCQLRWRDVDLNSGLLAGSTAKSKAKVQIPIFPPLFKELSGRKSAGEFCFPEQAQMYQENPSGINIRLRKFFEAAGYADAGARRAVKLPPAEEVRRCWAKRFPACASRFSSKVRTMLPRVLELYSAGKVIGQIMTELGLSKGSVSTYLKRIKEILGFSIVRTEREPVTIKDSALGKHKTGLVRVNQRGFHALRATWVTLALSAGVPIELVRRVTGHSLTETVLTNYFQPGREQFQLALQTAMPKMLTGGGAPSRDDQMRAILTKTSGKAWARDSQKLLQLLDGVQAS